MILESLLGLRIEGETLHLAPCLPADWPGCRIRYRFRQTMYYIAVSSAPTPENGKSGVIRTTLDGVACREGAILLVDDGREHRLALVVTTGYKSDTPLDNAVS